MTIDEWDRRMRLTCVEDRMVLIIDIGRRGKWDRDWRRLIESNVTHSCLQFSTLREEDGKGRRSDCGKWGYKVGEF